MGPHPETADPHLKVMRCAHGLGYPEADQQNICSAVTYFLRLFWRYEHGKSFAAGEAARKFDGKRHAASDGKSGASSRGNSSSNSVY